MFYLTGPDDRPEGWAGLDNTVGNEGNALLAIDYRTGKIAWRHDWYGGNGIVHNLSTAGNLLFTSNALNFIAFQASTGKILAACSARIAGEGWGCNPKRIKTPRCGRSCGQEGVASACHPIKLISLVGAGRFERPTPCAQGRCATRLRYAPTSAFVFNHLQPTIKSWHFQVQHRGDVQRKFSVHSGGIP